MRKVLTAEQMREVDRLTTERYGIPSILLMENAAHAVARVITEKLGGSVRWKTVLVLCGKGNNGGDGAAVARILSAQGAKVNVLFWGKPANFAGDAGVNFQMIESLSGYIQRKYIESTEELLDWWRFTRAERKIDVIVDAVFGTGLDRPLDHEYNSFLDIARDYILDRHRSLVVAVDLPSGLNADGGEPVSCPLEADVTVTFTCPKPATILPPSCHECGEIVVVPIGSPPALIDGSQSRLFVSERQDSVQWLWNTRFHDDSYKNKRGHALLVAGSESYSGAAVMCANSAMRSGVGLVTLAVPASVKSEIAARALPEVIVRPIAVNESGDVSTDAFASMHEMIGAADAIAVGCGLSTTDNGIRSLVTEIVNTRKVPVVVDAGALDLIAPIIAAAEPENHPVGEAPPPLLRKEGSPLILTPHEGEFMRLLGTDDKDAIKDRVAAVRDFAVKHSVILVLKGERVLIGEPGGKVVVNPTGNPGLGKAGNGDTLTGILTGFLAQAVRMQVDIFETVVAAVYIAGLAGDVARDKYGERVMTASDVRECLVEVFEKLKGLKVKK